MLPLSGEKNRNSTGYEISDQLDPMIFLDAFDCLKITGFGLFMKTAY